MVRPLVRSPAPTPNGAAFGFSSYAAAYGTAIGNNSRAGVNSVAIGNGAQASGADSTALGQGAVALHSNSVAIGSGSVTSAPNTVSFGSSGNRRRLTNIAPGKDKYDAATYGQVERVEKKANRGVAIVSAMDTFLPDPGKQFRLNFGGGYYGSEYAIGLTGSGRIKEDRGVYIGIGADTGFNDYAAKAGVSYQW